MTICKYIIYSIKGHFYTIIGNNGHGKNYLVQNWPKQSSPLEISQIAKIIMYKNYQSKICFVVVINCSFKNNKNLTHNT